MATTQHNIGLRETSKNVWRITIDGRVLGDSRGYDFDRATQEVNTMLASRQNWLAEFNEDWRFGSVVKLT